MKKKITAIFLCVALVAIAIAGASLAYFTDSDKATNTFTAGYVDIELAEPTWNETADHKLLPGIVHAKDPTITVKKDSLDSYIFLEMSLSKYNYLLWAMAADASADEKIDFTIFNTDGTLKNDYKNDDGVFSTTKFLAAMKDDKDVFQAIVNKWFHGITHEDWEILSFEPNTGAGKDQLTIKLAYIGGEKGAILKANDTVTFMKSFGIPASVTQEMINAGHLDGGLTSDELPTDNKPLNMTFTAYAVQAEGFASAAAAWNATFGA